MTHSPLTAWTAPTSKYNDIGPRAVNRLIIHHTAGGTNDGNIAVLSSSSREVSASYCLLTTGDLVGIVPEEYRPWTSNAPGYDNDRNSVTVETVNTTGAPDWGVSWAQVEKLAQLAADLCKRYGWGRVDRSRVVGHREVLPGGYTECPGPFLHGQLNNIVDRANAILSGATGAPAPNGEEIVKEFTGGSSRKAPQKIKGGNTEYITFRDKWTDDKWGDRTIARGPGFLSGTINIAMEGEAGTRVAFQLVRETGENKNRLQIADPRKTIDSLGKLSFQINFNRRLAEGQLVRLLARVQNGKEVEVTEFYWDGGRSE
ncbi:N-acetylmuramoyl-L-alanine amidase [Leucobacter viscericola]|uniref:N-acetylmuramoyl-L-alanine amidase n=1 Tax=Leucobacter viscericola TaxID=2714935 RepID=A0A6G7XJ47_9MICO|nr:N-acetylmuramoyl-L-alanine amidase [Leucobacter viscericola]QIK61791.1 N-acetylmuramoyl-L-alanine amidase [Leucobacter viscericola]QIK64573.1 N-acetylmuramoyl-L-alanine amidase [Leucobacter viscericola]